MAFAVTFLGFSMVGSLVAARLPGNPVSWLLLIQGLCWEFSGALAGYANYVLFARPGFLAGGTVAAWALNWLYLPAIAAAVLLFLLELDDFVSREPGLEETFLAYYGEPSGEMAGHGR